jgi:hypothetical protein
MQSNSVIVIIVIDNSEKLLFSNNFINLLQS